MSASSRQPESSPFANSLLRYVTPGQTCSYLPNEEESRVIQYVFRMGESGYEKLLERGWRRFGAQFFRPCCTACRKCQPLRIDVKAFRLSKSLKRVLRKNKEIEIIHQPPTVSDEHVALFNRYHAYMTDVRKWKPVQLDLKEYEASFLWGEHAFGREMLYIRDGQLVGVGLVDVVPRALSSVYFYHAPEWRDGAPGIFSILCEIDYAQQTNREYHYLGYYIAECPSMAYKARFRPHQILTDFVELDVEPRWEPRETGALADLA